VRRYTLSAGGGGTEQDLLINDIFLSPSSQQVKVSDIALELTTTEFMVLRLLMLNAAQRVTKEQISLKVLGKPLQAFDRSIDMHVSNLRKKISAVAPGDKIKTLRGVGYMLLPE
jgi:two-component system response regulator CpxR